MLTAPDPARPAPALSGEALFELARLVGLIGPRRARRCVHPNQLPQLRRLATYGSACDDRRLRFLMRQTVRGITQRYVRYWDHLLDIDRRAHADPVAVTRLATGGRLICLSVGTGGPWGAPTPGTARSHDSACGESQPFIPGFR